MNRSILIVICDFLLVSLLAFSTVDINNVADNGTARTVKLTQVHQPGGQRQGPRGGDEARAGGRAPETGAVARRTQPEPRVPHRSSRPCSPSANTRRRPCSSSLKPAISRQTVAGGEAALQKQFTDAQTNIEALNQQLQGSTADALISKEKLAAMEAELRKQTETGRHLAAAARPARAKQPGRPRRETTACRPAPACRGRAAYAAEQVTNLNEQVKVERQEKAQLAEGVKALATKSSELAKEIEDNRPLAANTIFNDFIHQPCPGQLHGTRSGLFGTNKHRDAETVLVTDGTNTFALCHVDDTPLTLFDPGTDWDTLSGTLQHGDAQVPIHALSFNDQDPRIVLVPVTAAEAEARLPGLQCFPRPV